MLMSVAAVYAERSTCSRAAVGSLIVRDGRIMSTGYNGTPSGMPHCEHPCTCELPTDRRYDCPRHGTAPKYRCKATVHAEANAIVFAARHGVATEGASLYTTMAPCVECSKLIVNAGIRHVICGEQYVDNAGIELLALAGVDVIW